MRHSKAEKVPDKDDFDRQLTERGRHDAAIMGQLIGKYPLVPEVLISSSAKRALETAEIVAKACGYPHKLQLEDEFYLCQSLTILNGLTKLPAEINTAMVVFHNPTLEELTADMTADSKLNAELATSSLVYLQVYTRDWAKVKNVPSVMKWVLTPKILRQYDS